jgi:hypothetical protein
MNIAVVIPLEWWLQLLEQFLPSIIAFSPEATIYIADNVLSQMNPSLLCNSTTLPLKS